MWTAVAVAVAGQVAARGRVKSEAELLLEEELDLRINNTSVKELWDRYSTLKLLLDPYAEKVLKQYKMILRLCRK